MTTTTTSTRPTPPTTPAARPKLPAGLKWSNVWRNPTGRLIESPDPTVELPVNDQYVISGKLWVCPTDGCAHTTWTFEPIADVVADAPCCVRHPSRLIPSLTSADDANPVQGARARAMAHIRGIYENRKRKAVDAAQKRVDEATKAVTDATRRTAADLRGHVPSVAASAAIIGAGTPFALTEAPLAAAVGFGTATFGAVVAYLVAYWVRRLRQADRKDAKQARKDRRAARHVAAGVLAAGLWLLVSAAAGILPLYVQGGFVLLLGFLLSFAVNNEHWQQLWATRHRLKELVRLRAEAERRRAEEAKKAAEERPTVPAPAPVDESDPAVVGARMAAEWTRIANSETVPPPFPMRRSWIVVEETRAVTVPVDGELVRIGWEFTIQAEPGALVSRSGMLPPLVAARDWLASVLEVDPSKLSLVDRPEGQINRGLMMLTERVPLGNDVTYKGRAGIRRGSDGSLYGHAGCSLLGNDVERVLWVPGQAGGGGRYGVTGSGKSVVTQISLLNDLYAGIFGVLWDGKNLMDFAEFIGIIPVGCTREHRDVMRQSFRAEMERRQQMLMMMEGTDRHGRPAPVEALWVPGRDGPPCRWTIEEFHMNARDESFINELTEMVRLQRSSAIMVEIATQGGGLADAGNSVLRDQLNQIAMQIMRMGDSQARLTGYKGDYMPSELPRLPGMMLMVEADAPAVPVRGAYVHRRDEDGSIYDHLYDRNNQQILAPPTLPAETLEVFEREGLMDLWRLGQGPGGKARLLAGDVSSPSTVTAKSAGIGAASVLDATDVVLAIAFLNPGCGNTFVGDHTAWNHGRAGGKKPAPSTISRALQKLEAAGKLTRVKGVGDYRVTAKGGDEAKVAAVLLGLVAAAPPTAAEVERQAEMSAEVTA